MGKKKPQTTSLECKERVLGRCPFPDSCASEAEFDLEIQVLKIPVLSSKTFAPLPPTTDLFLCNLLIYLLKALEVGLFIFEFSVSLVLLYHWYLGVLWFEFVFVVFGDF